MLRLCSFGRSLLWPVSGPGSVRRSFRLLAAARRRWPGGRWSFHSPVGLVRLVELDGSLCGWGCEWRGFSLSLDVDGCFAAGVSLWEPMHSRVVTLLEW